MEWMKLGFEFGK